MELADVMFGDNNLTMQTQFGELLPDPNLIQNIDHLISFIAVELKNWSEHSAVLSEKLSTEPSHIRASYLMESSNVRFYIKALFNVSTYYVTCEDAITKLNTQLQILNKHYQLNQRKPKIDDKSDFHTKVKLIRNCSFIHQNTTTFTGQTDNIKGQMEKRKAMSWFPSLNWSAEEEPSCESYEFGTSNWYTSINGSKYESSIEISVHGFSQFAKSAIENLENKKVKLIEFYENMLNYKKQ
ncbi:hypothetical protein A5320_11585 [Rheinheimera sp. SA_1]|uniref:hypothetical protein n=1 Tax=Rheinheimera sp. SA_1 TaxID=1827365 RepID=UPI000800C3FC|nr:hypothetical protein [Rheinheimera sp. SA_1]OBP14411.1 hypothetical protein A5320_11585 [Rheinheimera sp. SA_1]